MKENTTKKILSISCLSPLGRGCAIGDGIIFNDFDCDALYAVTAILPYWIGNSFISQKNYINRSLSKISVNDFWVQIEQICNNFNISAIKIGFLGNVKIIEAVARMFSQTNIPIVCDPCFRFSDDLYSGKLIMSKIVPITNLFVATAEEVAPILSRKIPKSVEDISDIAYELMEKGCESVLIRSDLFSGLECQGKAIFMNKYGVQNHIEYFLPKKNIIDSKVDFPCLASAAATALIGKGLFIPIAAQKAHDYACYIIGKINIDHNVL